MRRWGQDGTYTVDVLDVQGAYVGSYSMERTRSPVAFGPNGLAAFFESDELGAETVVVRRLSLEVN